MRQVQDVRVKDAFKEHYTFLLGSEEAYERFMEASLSYPRRSIRVNTLKMPIDALVARVRAKGWRLDPVPWCPEGFFIEGDRRDVGNMEEHVLGYFYIQEASSMIPPMMLAPKPGDVVLDMAAAPGSKSSQIAAMMGNTGVLIANELDYSRISALKSNLERCGVYCAIITNKDGRRITIEGFDKILLDAPCSGTGTISKSLKTLDMWNPRSLRKLTTLQSQLIDHAYGLLREGGELVYSTCSLEVEENELIIDAFLRKHPRARLVALDFPHASTSFLEYKGEKLDPRIAGTIRMWPHHSGTDGFFIAKIVKDESHDAS